MVRKRYRVIEQKYEKQTNKLVETKIVGREMTATRVNAYIRATIKGWEALDPGYSDYKTLHEGDYWLFYFYSPNFLKKYYFVYTVDVEKNIV